MVSVSFSEDELKLIESLVKKELEKFIHDEPLRPDLIVLKGEVGYEQFLKGLLVKVKKKS